MKKIIILSMMFMVGISSFAYKPVDIDKKLMTLFSTSFPNAEGVSWLELPESYIVNFMEDGIRSRIIYLRNRILVRYTRYYFEGNLPVEIRLNLKFQYPDKKIYGVTEISTVSKAGDVTVEYFVKMENGKFWTTVRVNKHGDMEVTERLRKI